VDYQAMLNSVGGSGPSRKLNRGVVGWGVDARAQLPFVLCRPAGAMSFFVCLRQLPSANA
jgi:hypothetical protein